MFLTIFNTLTPLIFLVVLGVLLRKFKFAEADFFTKCNSLVFHIALPCLLFDAISTGEKNIDKAANIFFVMLAGTIGSIIIGWLYTKIFKVHSGSKGVFVQGSFRGNLAYVGLTIIMFSDFTEPLTSKAAVSLAALAFAPLIPLYNIVSVAVLLADSHDSNISLKNRLVDMTKKIGTNPLFLACVLGTAYSFTPLTIPVAIHRCLAAIGQIALPMAVMGIGSTLYNGGVKSDIPAAMAASVIKLIISPLLGLVAAFAIGLDSNELKIALVMLGTPTAVASFVMADQLKANGKMASSIVVISTLLSALSIAAILAYTAFS